MAETGNRVLARKGARNLTLDEVEQVGGVGTPIFFTAPLTNMGRDHGFDEMQG